MKLSIVIPIYNEIHTIDTVLAKVVEVLPNVSKEIVLVDDGSTDGTREWLAQTFQGKSFQGARVLGESQQVVFSDGYSEAVDNVPSSVVAVAETSTDVTVILHEKNMGKGAALRTGFEAAKGDVIVVQDADLEYDPQDWTRMWPLIEEGKADIVYGSRFYGNPHRVLYFHHLLGNKVISNVINVLCNTTLSDIEVCYKMFRRDVLDGIRLVSNDFGFEVEFTVKVTLSRRRWRIYETGISYFGRTYAEGKKINWKDGVKALWYIVKFRFFG
ncbi:MAG: glycosyltransferase family 2 protein [Cyanobacteria bacterium P01_E01_bin.6]